LGPIIRDTPAALVENGRIHCGFFRRPFETVNLLDAPNMGGLPGRPVRWFRLKEWIGFGVSHPRLFGAFFIQNARYAASGIVYLYDRKTGRKYEWPMVELPVRARLAGTLWNSRSRCGLGDSEIVFDHNLSRSIHHVRARCGAGRGEPSLDADLVFHQNLQTTDPLVVSLPIPPDHHTYTHKSPLHIDGLVSIGDEEFVFDRARDMGNLDEQKTFYPYRSHWFWGSFAGRSEKGREVMVNFVDQMTARGEPAEDAMWVDGRLMLMDPVDFIAGAGHGSSALRTGRGGYGSALPPRGQRRKNAIICWSRWTTSSFLDGTTASWSMTPGPPMK
jgi:hypothetical protein